MIEDLRFAWRSLRHRPGTALVAVLCLALGIGANTALFGVLDALLFRPPAGVAAPSELARLSVGDPAAATRGAGSSATWPLFEETRERLADMATVAAYAPRTLTLSGGGEAEAVQAVIATGNYFAVLGVRAQRGRLFTADEDDVRGAPAVAVLSHTAWQRRYAGDGSVVGRVVHLNGVPVTIIGVAARGFGGVDLGEPELWLPVRVAALEEFGGERQFTWRVYWLQMLARRAPGVTPSTLEYVASGAGADPWAVPRPVAVHARPLRAMFFGEQRGASPVPPWAIGITIAVLLLACATVANLLLARNVVRERDIAIRMALGATRTRVLRQLLLENLLIALAAAACATVLAAWSAGLLRTLPLPVIPRLVDLRVAAFAYAIALASTLLFGALPALRAARGGLEAVLRSGRGSPGHSRMQHALMVTQIALCFTLLVGAGLFVASFDNARRIHVGFDLDRVLTVSVPMGAAPAAERALLVERAMAHVAHVNGVEAVGAGGIVPFHFMSRGSFAIPDGRNAEDQPVSLLVNAVAGDWFGTMGIPLLAGRALDERDAAGAPLVAVVSESVARAYWPGEDVVGRCIRLGVPHGDACVTIIGVARDVRFEDLRGEPSRLLYVAAAQDPRGGSPATLFVRTRGAATEHVPLVRGALQQMRASPYVDVQPLDTRARPQRIEWEVAARLFSTFGALAVLLAAVGLYMVVAFIVAQRTHEIGVRMSLGATRGAVLRLVLGRGIRLAVHGIAAGSLCALALARLVSARLYGIGPADVQTYAGVALLLTGVAVAASVLPARAAAATDPMRVLREE